MPRVVLLGDGAAALAPRFAELGIDVAEEPDGAFVLGVGGDARDALVHAGRDGVLGAIGVDGEPPVEEARAGALKAPVLGIFAETHEGSAYSFAKALTEHGVLNETVVYDGVEPGFLGVHEHATADVWRLVRRFMGVPAPG